jgi:hypothetical protein
MLVKRQKTRKLFYNKWPYKIECYLKYSSNVIRLGIPKTQEWINGSTSDNWLWKGADKKEIQSFVSAISAFIDKDMQIRTEGSRCSIFIKDKAIVDAIINQLDQWIVGITEPGSDEEYEFLVNNTAKKILCNALPYEKYHFRIYLKNKMTIDQKQRFFQWLSRYGDRFNVARSTKNWLTGAVRYAQDPFLYIQDRPTLSMVGLYLGDNVKRTEEFIPRTVINTECPT